VIDPTERTYNFSDPVWIDGLFRNHGLISLSSVDVPMIRKEILVKISF
jgi:hypothetical protein